MLIDIIAGARPNFVKIAQIIQEFASTEFKDEALTYRLVHTGQHYDRTMSGSFFEELNIPEPDVNLGVGSGSQAEQTGAIMVGYEKLLTQKCCDICLVVGDVTSTMACSIVAKKMGAKVAHVEGGLRSRDWTMPEEINRAVTDSITDYFFTTSEFANENLRNEGVAEEKVFFVGNTMIDTLVANMSKFKPPQIWHDLNLQEKLYLVLTLHRPSNVDEEAELMALIAKIAEQAKDVPVIFPVHPRTAQNLANNTNLPTNLHTIDPLSYLEFNYLVKHAFGVLTDSGGITEETTYMGVPCITLRTTTERPETIATGTNELVGLDHAAIASAMARLHAGEWKQGAIPALWDGKASNRILRALQAMNA